MLILAPAFFAVCGHLVSPRIAIVFSIPSSLPDLVRVTFVFFRHLLFITHRVPPCTSLLVTHRVPPCVLHIILLCELYSVLHSHKGISVHLRLLSTTGIPLLGGGRCSFLQQEEGVFFGRNGISLASVCLVFLLSGCSRGFECFTTT